MSRLTRAQRAALKVIERNHQAFHPIRFPTGEALRKAGLVVRETTHVAKRIYANKDGEHVQFAQPAENYVVRHEWFITPAGRAALSQEPSHER